MNDRQSRIAAQLAETRDLRKQCVKFLAGHPAADAADEYAAISAWVRENKADPDVYGQGAFLNEFERKIAALLGAEAAVFMPTGTMAQQIALRLWSDGHVGMHPTSHLELHEFRAYAHVHRLNVTLIGPKQRPMLASESAKTRSSWTWNNRRTRSPSCFDNHKEHENTKVIFTAEMPRARRK